MNPPTWNSLEVVKLIVSALTPVVVVLFGFWFNRRLKQFESRQWVNQKAIEKRLEVYSALAPVLNDLYCYFDYIGPWKVKDPEMVLDAKRCADRLFYVNESLFSKRFWNAYSDFINLLFIPGPLKEYASSATLRTDIEIRKEIFTQNKVDWKTEWNDKYFAPPERVTPRDRIRPEYRKMMDAFAQELGIGLKESDS
jgi:hypothetical protein